MVLQCLCQSSDRSVLTSFLGNFSEIEFRMGQTICTCNFPRALRRGLESFATDLQVKYNLISGKS